ncbi:MAG: hypothetical protein J6V62_00370 [Paludibacteraceae bacterium]|nr:hypothetical protein [Paludibacteraceae bacterium]
MQSGIDTPKRYIYLNTYAFLLLLAAISIGCLPLYKLGTWYVVAQVVVAFLLLSYAMKIFKQFQAKKRRYHKLIEINQQELVPESFEEYMQAPCGRLLVRVVLDDINHPEAYPALKKLKAPLKQRIKMACVPKKTVIYVAKPPEK